MAREFELGDKVEVDQAGLAAPLKHIALPQGRRGTVKSVANLEAGMLGVQFEGEEQYPVQFYRAVRFRRVTGQ